MSSFKRKRDDHDDDDFEEDSPSYGRQILPVANLPEDFNEEPMDGLQYLFMVRRDARKLPGTVRVANPYAQPEQAPELAPSPPPAPTHLQLPSKEWRKVFEYRFNNLRKNFDQTTTTIGPVLPVQARLMPEKKDRELWWAFLSGRTEEEWTPVKKGKGKQKRVTPQQPASEASQTSLHVVPPTADERGPVSDNSTWNNDEGEVEEVLRLNPAETLPSPVGTPVPLDCLEKMAQPSATAAAPLEEPLIPRECTTQLLKLIDERTALHLLMYFTHWINTYLRNPESSEYLLTDCHARWVMSLLSRVDDFVSPDDMHLLRNLARACVGLLKHTKENSDMPIRLDHNPKIMTEPFCWMIISTIADVWKQKDLWMDAEGALNALHVHI